MFIYNPDNTGFRHVLKQKLDIPRTHKFKTFMGKYADVVGLLTACRVAEGLAPRYPNSNITLYVPPRMQKYKHLCNVMLSGAPADSAAAKPPPQKLLPRGEVTAADVTAQANKIARYYEAAGRRVNLPALRVYPHTVVPRQLTLDVNTAGTTAISRRAAAALVRIPPAPIMRMPSAALTVRPPMSLMRLPTPASLFAGVAPIRLYASRLVAARMLRGQFLSRRAVRRIFSKFRHEYLSELGADLAWTLRDRYRFPEKPVAPIHLASAEEIHQAQASDIGGIEPKTGDPAPGSLIVRAKQLPKRTQTFVHWEVITMQSFTDSSYMPLSPSQSREWIGASKSALQAAGIRSTILEVTVLDTPGLTPFSAFPEDYPGPMGVIAFIPVGGLRRRNGKPWVMYKPEGEVFRETIYAKYGGQWIVRRGEKAAFLFNAYRQSAVDFSKLPAGRFQDLY